MRPGPAALLVAVVLAGCGGGSTRELPVTATRPVPGTSTESAAADAVLDPKLVAALGDSITAGSPLWDPDPDARAQLAAPTGMEPDERSQWGYWFERADRQRRKVRNCGVFGERTDQIALRLQRCATGAATLVVQGGINDIAQGRSVTDAGKDLEAMVQAGKAGGRKVALVEVLPWNNGYPAAAPRITELNTRIRAIGRRQAVPVFPWFGALEDPAARGRMRADLTVDGDHPSVAGYKRLAGLVELP